jgi:hypothetical protein
MKKTFLALLILTFSQSAFSGDDGPGNSYLEQFNEAGMQIDTFCKTKNEGDEIHLSYSSGFVELGGKATDNVFTFNRDEGDIEINLEDVKLFNRWQNLSRWGYPSSDNSNQRGVIKIKKLDGTIFNQNFGHKLSNDLKELSIEVSCQGSSTID